MKYLTLPCILTLAACLPADVSVQDRPTQTRTVAAAAPAPQLPPEIVAPVSTGLPVTATVDCSVGGIGLFGSCDQEATATCTRAGLTLSRLEQIDPENPGVAGIATNNASIVESGLKPATHRVICV
ncbi:hypothetical protein [Pseudaestuariivita atlantica]|uniref:Lipoprotein n=1 Tax=Pseudaestuariivita atlantica TaxID=1317121 RepID=A0A0L1JJQ6_9RHOB|nr:hypothetical protein [Pseudaestuariivita atlantica]KNG91981.1 hypothetical protein ATO11_19760 [Pseudaestuariivita atlantica]